MQAEMFETMSKLSQTTLENYRRLGENNLKIGEKLLQEQAELTESLLEVASSGAEKATGAKDFQSVASNQAELVQEYGQLVWASAKNCAEIMAEAGKFYNQLFEAGLKTAGANGFTPKAAAKGKKAA